MVCHSPMVQDDRSAFRGLPLCASNLAEGAGQCDEANPFDGEVGNRARPRMAGLPDVGVTAPGGTVQLTQRCPSVPPSRLCQEMIVADATAASRIA